MHALRFPLVMAFVIAVLVVVTAPAPAWAYIGPGPGLEFVPYFMSLLLWLGAAFGGMLLWPVSALIGRWRHGRPSTSAAEDKIAMPS